MYVFYMDVLCMVCVWYLVCVERICYNVWPRLTILCMMTYLWNVYVTLCISLNVTAMFCAVLATWGIYCNLSYNPHPHSPVPSDTLRQEECNRLEQILFRRQCTLSETLHVYIMVLVRYSLVSIICQQAVVHVSSSKCCLATPNLASIDITSHCCLSPLCMSVCATLLVLSFLVFARHSFHVYLPLY